MQKLVFFSSAFVWKKEEFIFIKKYEILRIELKVGFLGMYSENYEDEEEDFPLAVDDRGE